MILPQVATGLAFGALAWLAWAARRHPVLTTFLWVLFAFDLAFVAWFVVEAWGCSPSSCENDQAAVIIVFMVVVDILLTVLFMIVGFLGWLRRQRTAPGA